MPASKATPKAEVTLVSKDDAGWKFAHSPSALSDFSVKQKLGQKFTFGVGFTDNTVRKIQKIPGLVLSGDLKVSNDVTLTASRNIATKATKAGITYNTKVADKKTTFKVNYLTPTNAITGEVISQLAPNKKATVAFNDKQVTNVKIALTDDKFVYEPSYNLVRKAPSLAISRSMHGGKYKFGWNLKTDDLSLEYSYKYLKFAAFKRPDQPVPRLAASIEHDFELNFLESKPKAKAVEAAAPQKGAADKKGSGAADKKGAEKAAAGKAPAGKDAKTQQGSIFRK